MKIAVEGCAHGELERIYNCIETMQTREGIQIDLLICCGDFQSVRNRSDMSAMAVPDKYKHMCTFYKYYSGEKKAPILTIFIGGNHEASNYLQELPFGGWVAPNIYYLGRAGVIQFGNLRIGGMSGIFKGHDYLHGLWESVPYTSNSIRSVYHIRSLDVFRLSQLKEKVHVMLSHDWPRGITDYGDTENLLRLKPFLREDVESNQLGCPPAMTLLQTLQPDYWFAAHLHCKFAALVEHEDSKETKFLALDKCLPKRRHLQVLDLPSEYDGDKVLKHDAEWLAVLKSTNNLLSVKNMDCHMPGPGSGGDERHEFTPTEEEKKAILDIMKDMTIKEDSFVRTAPIHNPMEPNSTIKDLILNPQTAHLCELLGIDDPVQVVAARSGRSMKVPEKFETIMVSPSPVTQTPPIVETPPQSVIKCSKMSLPAPITPNVEEIDINDEDPPPDSSYVTDSLDITEELSTPITKKTFKRRNLSIYNTPEVDHNESSTSTLQEESSPCKLTCNPEQS